MIKKNTYITPMISFEEVENDTALCDISVKADDQGWESCAKETSPSFWDDDFAEPTEDTTSDFVFNNESNW